MCLGQGEFDLAGAGFTNQTYFIVFIVEACSLIYLTSYSLSSFVDTEGEERPL